LATLHIPQRHLRKGKSWTIGLFYVPLEFQPKMKNWIYHHSTGFLNYTSVLVLQLRVRNSSVKGREVKCFNAIAGEEGPRLYVL
jgi:hypothetical protein